MKPRSRLLAIAASGIIALGLSTAGATAAFAGGAPTVCPTPTSTAGLPNSGGHTNAGGTCQITGTINVSSEVSIATNLTSFTLSSTALNSPDPATPWQIVIGSSDSLGYYASIFGPAGGFTNTTNPSATKAPDSIVSYWGNQTSTPVTGGSCTTANANFGYQTLQDPSSFSGNPLLLQVVSVGAQTSGQLNCATHFTGYTVPAGFDSFDLNGFELTTVDGVPSGTYSGTVLLSAWGV